MRRVASLTLLILSAWCSSSLPSLGSTAAAAGAPLRIEARWPGVHLVSYDALKLKSVVAEFDTFLAVVEVPHDDATAGALLALLREKFPGKPLRFALHTHHHDHSIGALDPLIDAGVTVVTTPWNLEQIRKLAADPGRVDGHVLTIRQTFEIADSTNALRARVLRAGQYEVPADEYVLVEFPAQQALVTGCLFNKPLDYFEVVNGRKLALAAYLGDAKLDPAWLVPTNTTQAAGFEDVCTRAMLSETLEKGLQPDQFAKRLQARSVAELRADLDGLAKEFQALAPRSYDLLVCGNYLKAKRQDYQRAAIVFEVTARLFPQEIDAWWYLGETWTLENNQSKAIEAWKRGLELATEDKDKARFRRVLGN